MVFATQASCTPCDAVYYTHFNACMFIEQGYSINIALIAGMALYIFCEKLMF